MLRAVLRLLLALGGGAAATVIVALIEARAVASAGAASVPAMELVLALLGVLFPVAVGVGVGIGAASLVLDPGEPTSPFAFAAALRHGSVLERLRRATIAPVLVLVVFAWTTASAYAARETLAYGTPLESGLATSVASIGVFVAIAAAGVALVPVLRRVLAILSESVPQLLDPTITGGLAFVFAIAVMLVGIATGDTSGNGGVLGIFGVLKRPELDLRPVANAFVVVLGAWLAPVAIGRRKILDPKGRPRAEVMLGAAAALGMALALAVLCAWSAKSLSGADEVRRGLEKDAPLAKISLAVLRKASDRDHDGYSARFGGGDCDDENKEINPGALDVPGNGLDEDCTGADTPLVVDDGKPTHVTSADAAAAKRPDRPLNVVLITIDTLRADNLGFAGYPKPVSPNLDALAAKATVFERGYSMASYTGKAVGPMLIGKYPSETNRNFSHFDTYYPPNTFVAERLHAAGIRTFAGMCHWYFRLSSGLAQGFDTWDTSAIPPGMGDNDNSVTSDRESDLAIALLSKPENVDKQFFAWFHYFDPHAQYVPHPGAPDFVGGEKSPGAVLRAGYDGEVWFTDKHIGRVLDFIAQKPWAANTAIVVTADHGEAFGEHNMAWHGREIWEPLVRVPLVVYVPGVDPRRVAVKRSHIDLAPTILELAGVPLPEERGELQGTSLLEDVFAPKDAELEERDVLIDMPKGPFNDARRAIISGKSPGMKLIHFGGLYYNLFDLSEDPGEKNDLSKDKEKVKELNARLSLIRGRMKEFAVKEDDAQKK